MEKEKREMSKKMIKLIVGLLLIMFLSGNSYADRRSYVWTYEYMTMLKGRAEIEYYMTTQVPDWNEPEINTWKHWIELEYGITERWDISMYQQFKQTNKSKGSNFEYDGFKIRTRYRIGEKNQYPLDTLLYFEYIRDDDFSKPSVFEGKLILAKDIGKLNMAYNQIIKQKTDLDSKTEHEYASAISYEIAPLFRLGIESKGNYTEKKYYVGPSLSIAVGRVWAAFGAAFGVNDGSDDIQTRLIIGVLF